MRIALFNQFFWPDQAATSQLLTDLARRLAHDGHDVVAVCGAAGYAGEDGESRPPVIILSSPSLPFSRGTAARLGSYLSYLVSATWRVVTMGRVDVVITMTTPPLVSTLGNLAKALHGAHHIVWEMDVYPEVAVEVGMMHDSWTTRALSALSRGSRNRADTVWALGECMRTRLLNAGVAAERLQVHQNWSDPELFAAPVDPAPDRLRLIYSGNLGLTHDVATLRDAMLQLRDDGRISVEIAGGGPRRAELEAFVRLQGLSNVEFAPYRSKRELKQAMADADVGLVTLSTGCAGLVVPSKVYGLMACGRPILFVGPAASTSAAVIEAFGCGWRVECGDVSGLVDLLSLLVTRPDLIREAGQRGRAAFLAHFAREEAVARLSAALEDRVRAARTPAVAADGETRVRTTSG